MQVALLGDATVLVEMGPMRILMDPVLQDPFENGMVVSCPKRAIDDTCTHRGGPLSEGVVDGATVTCPWHGATFDVTSGGVLGPPAGSGVTSYRVEIDGGDIKLELA